MSLRSPPLRFLTLVVGGWVCGRALFLAPAWLAEPVVAAGGGPRPILATAPRLKPAEDKPELRSSRAKSRSVAAAVMHNALRQFPSREHRPVLARAVVARPSSSLGTKEVWRPALLPSVSSPPTPAPPFALEKRRVPSPGRWSFSGWAFLREGEAPALAPGGLLGGSQIGGRLVYRLSPGGARPLAVSARFYTPAERRSGAEAALGIDWRPLKRLPVHLLAERRQALGREGRSAFALTAYGGLSEVALGGFRLDAYGQTGVVGTRSRDLFADGAVRLSLPMNEQGRLKIGLGAWAAAQPGVSRVDVGPQASLRLPVASGSVTVAADWRLNVRGNAQPGSGPSLTVSTDF